MCIPPEVGSLCKDRILLVQRPFGPLKAEKNS